MLESSVEKRCMSYVRSKGGIGIKLSPINRRGIPDRLVLLPGGKVLFIEFKRPGGKPRGNQQYWLARLQCMGFTAECMDNSDDFVKLIDRGI